MKEKSTNVSSHCHYCIASMPSVFLAGLHSAPGLNYFPLYSNIRNLHSSEVICVLNLHMKKIFKSLHKQLAVSNS